MVVDRVQPGDEVEGRDDICGAPVSCCFGCDPAGCVECERSSEFDIDGTRAGCRWRRPGCLLAYDIGSGIVHQRRDVRSCHAAALRSRSRHVRLQEQRVTESDRHTGPDDSGDFAYGVLRPDAGGQRAWHQGVRRGDDAFGFSIGIDVKVGNRCIEVSGLTEAELQDNYAPDVAMAKIMIAALH
jgi:hypothetical protein